MAVVSGVGSPSVRRTRLMADHCQPNSSLTEVIAAAAAESESIAYVDFRRRFMNTRISLAPWMSPFCSATSIPWV